MAQLKPLKTEEPFNYEESDFDLYLNSIIHEWLKTLTTLAYILVPMFFFLDYFIMPSELLPRFGVYRLISTIIVIIQFIYFHDGREIIFVPSINIRQITLLYNYGSPLFLMLLLGGILIWRVILRTNSIY